MIMRCKVTVDTSHYPKEGPWELPRGWAWSTIEDISNCILYGVSESAKSTGSYKLLRITDIQEGKVDWDKVPFTDFDENKAEKYLLNDGDILFARTGATVGKSYLTSEVPQAALFASYLIRVRYSNLMSPQYVKLFFESGYYWEQISSSSVGVGQPNVNGTSLGKLKIPIPPVAEQHRVAEEAYKLINKIDELDCYAEALNQDITATKSTIIDLAVHGKLVPQDPSDEPAIDLLKRINPDFVPSDNLHYVGDVPKGWQLLTFNDVAEYINGRAFKPEEWEPAGTRIIRIQNLNDNSVPYNHSTSEFDDKYLVRNGDLLFAWAASLGVYIWNGPEAWLNQHIFKVIPRKFIKREYLYLALAASVSAFYQKSHGSGMVHITRQEFLSMPILLPPIKEQDRIIKRLEPLFAILNSTAEIVKE